MVVVKYRGEGGGPPRRAQLPPRRAQLPPGPKVVLPSLGEFGLALRYHVPAVHAMAGPKIVMHEPGRECLYPSADALVEVPNAVDRARDKLYCETEERAALKNVARARWPDHDVVANCKGLPERRFIPEPHERYPIGPVDVVVCPRKRVFGPSKNWQGWTELTDSLSSRLYVFSAGAPDSSDEVEGPKAWDYPRSLDASVQAMLSAKLVVATDAGLAHLAVLCGVPLLMVTYHGLVAPGRVEHADGKAVGSAYWPVRLDEYYTSANHTGSLIELIDGWEHVDRVVERALQIVGGT